MKANSLRSRILLVLSILLLLTFTCGALSFGGTKVNADVDLENAVSSFKMLDKQQLRTEDPVGMRFAATMSVEEYTALTGENSAYTAVDFGFFIMPKYYEKAGAINYDNTFGSDAVFTWDEKTGTTTVADPYEILHADGVQAVLGKVEENGEDLYLIKGSLVDINDQNLATKFTARMYVKATKADNSVVYAFADQMTTASSMVDVAIRGIDKGDSALQSYVDKYVAYYKAANDGAEPTYSYTVNYYVDGTATPVKSEVVSGNAINTDVSITAKAPDGYILDSANASKNVLSGKVYADNDLTLSVYVKEIQYKALTGTLNGGELYFFEKQTAETTYDIVLPVALGNVNPIVKIADVELTATYEDATKTLSLLPEEFASFGNGQTSITIITSDTVYTADVTIADYVITSENEYKTVFPAGGTARFTNYVVLGNDITFTSSYAGYAGVYVGVFDGKGYAIKNLSMPESAIGMFQEMHGQILNLALINVKANGHGGVIANVMGGLINNVFVQGVAAGHGSLGNSVSNTLSNSIVIVEKNSFDLTTGAIANNMKGTATNCFAVSKSFVNAFNNPTGTVNNCDIKTSAEDLVALFNGTLPAGFNAYWSLSNGMLKFGDEVIYKPTVKLTNAQNVGGQLFYFGKDTTDCADYASNFISGENYVIQTAIDLGMVESVKIGTTAITGFAYANKQLTIPVAQIASLANGDAVMEIVTATADYSADVTIADYVITTETEYRKALGENGVYQEKLSGYFVLARDIDFNNANYAGHGDGGKPFAGTLDGKGYAIKNITLTGNGLIEQTGGSGVIKNLAIINATHTAANVGLLLNQHNGKVENVFVSGLMASRSVINACYASGKISNVIVDVEKVANVTYTGAVVRSLEGTATNCYATSDTFTTTYHTATGTATNCEFKATNAELLAYFNGTLPTGFNSYWTISNGSLSFGNNVVMSAN